MGTALARYPRYPVPLVEGDSAVGSAAEMTARRIQLQYGKAAAGDDPGTK